MPHSSGGGSSSGGSHGGSHGGRSTGSRVSRHYVEGATRYRYTNRRGKSSYYYVTGEPEKTPFVFLFISILILLAFIFILRNAMIDQILFYPEKLDTAGYSSGVTVSDRTGLMDTALLEDSMQEFLDATGVSPAVEFVYTDDVSGDLESYAYSRYVTLFDDERHWLIEISLPRGFRDAVRPKWRWEGMIGDECYPAVSSGTEDRLTKTVQFQLLMANGQNIEKRLANAWSEMARRAPKTQVNKEVAAAGCFFLAFSGAMLGVCVRTFREGWQLKHAVIDPEPPDMNHN